MEKSTLAKCHLKRCLITAKRMVRRSFLFSGIFFALISVLTTAEDLSQAAPGKVTPWTPEDILSAENAFQWNISPDGKWAVWVKTQMDKEKNGRVSNLFLTNLETKEEVQLTRGNENHSRPEWSPNGERISFTSTRALPKPNPDISRSQVWLMNPFGGEPWPLTEFVRGIQIYRWVDDDTIIFSAQEDPALFEQEVKKKKDTTRVVDDVDHEPPVRLFKLAVKDKKVTRLTDNTDFIQSWAVTPDGKKAAAVHGQYLSFAWDQKILPKTFLYDLVKGERKEIFAGRRIVPMGLEWTRDGSGFYALAPYSSDPRFFTATITLVYFYDVASDKSIEVDLSWENGLGGGFEVTPDGFITLLAAGVRFQPARYVKDGLAWKKTDIEGDHVRNLFNFAVSKDARTIVYEHSTAGTPTQWFTATLEGSRLTNAAKITDLNPSFKNRTSAKTEVVRWKGALGEEIDGILYYPKDYQPGKKYPLLTAPHGGPAGADLDSWEESWAYAHQLLSQRGTFILKPNYHGSSNYGLKFVESICCGKYYDLPVEDIEKGVDLLVAKGMVDPDRVGTFGWSNGSILSIQLGVVNPDRYKVIAAGAGDVEWISDWANVDFGPFEKAKGYAAWLSGLTGQAWRVPNEDEVASLYQGPAKENTLDYWAGYAPNPDDTRRLKAKVEELGGGAPLLKQAGSFAGAGKDGEPLVFDLNGNVAEWAVNKEGSGKKMGGSADQPSDPRAQSGSAAMEYTGFRVVRGKVGRIQTLQPGTRLPRDEPVQAARGQAGHYLF